MNFEQLKAKVIEFTDVEIVLMEEWLGGVLQGFLRPANRVLRTGLLLEHWQSVLDPDPDKQSDEEKAFEAELQADFDAARVELADARDDGKAEVGPVERRENIQENR